MKPSRRRPRCSSWSRNARTTACTGGYVEAFRRDWGTPYPWQRPYAGGGASRHKSLNTHLHYMEALAAYQRVSARPLVQERLVELIGIETSQVYKAFGDASTNLFERDWTPGAAKARCSLLLRPRPREHLARRGCVQGRGNSGRDRMYRYSVASSTPA